MIRQDFFLGSSYLGTAERKLQFLGTHVVLPESKLWFCPHCGDVWARAVVEKAEWQSYRVPCPKHPKGGSLWLSWDKEYLAALPKPVLEYEFTRLVKMFDEGEMTYE